MGLTNRLARRTRCMAANVGYAVWTMHDTAEFTGVERLFGSRNILLSSHARNARSSCALGYFVRTQVWQSVDVRGLRRSPLIRIAVRWRRSQRCLGHTVGANVSAETGRGSASPMGQGSEIAGHRGDRAASSTATTERPSGGPSPTEAVSLPR